MKKSRICFLRFKSQEKMMTWNTVAVMEVMRNGGIWIYFEDRAGKTLMNWDVKEKDKS